MAWQLISAGVTVKCVVCPVQWMRLMMICCGMALKRLGMLGVSVREMKALTLKMETVTMIGKGS
jgi:hypothetical protein